MRSVFLCFACVWGWKEPDCDTAVSTKCDRANDYCKSLCAGRRRRGHSCHDDEIFKRYCKFIDWIPKNQVAEIVSYNFRKHDDHECEDDHDDDSDDRGYVQDDGSMPHPLDGVSLAVDVRDGSDVGGDYGTRNSTHTPESVAFLAPRTGKPLHAGYDAFMNGPSLNGVPPSDRCNGAEEGSDCFNHEIYGNLHISLRPGLKAATPAECQLECQKVDGCEQWTWTSPLFGPDELLCTLKSREMLIEASCTNDSDVDFECQRDVAEERFWHPQNRQATEDQPRPCVSYVKRACELGILNCRQLPSGAPVCVYGSALHISGPRHCGLEGPCRQRPIKCPRPTAAPAPTTAPLLTTTAFPSTSLTTALPDLPLTTARPTTARQETTATPNQVFETPTGTRVVTFGACTGGDCDCPDLALEFNRLPARVALSY